MEFRLLGPVEVWTRGRSVPLGGAKPRALLAALLLERGRVVPTTRLIDIVWGDDPPDSARALIQTYVSSLRQALAKHGFSDVLVTRSPGYVAEVAADRVDRDVFGKLVAHSRTASPEVAAKLLGEALALWRGPALAGLEESLLAGAAAQLEELRLAATEDRVAAELSLGRIDNLIPELTLLVEQHPVNERFRGQLMTVLYRLGRQADALAAYRDFREVLAEELGLDPGSELQTIHQLILSGEPPVAAVPAQLPHLASDFTGRRDEIVALTNPAAAPVRVISGQGGAGKSTLAIRVADALAPSFPDGQLFADLRAMTDTPAVPGDVLGRFLRALGVEPARLPESADERAELYRTLLAGRKFLVVLDNAGDERQVRSLLPGNPQCVVLITARERLNLPGSQMVELDVLPTADAVELLDRVVGDERVGADPESAARIASYCGHLPLAIRIAGARLANRKRLPLEWLADRLADESERLNELSKGDIGVRASIELSCRGLEPEAVLALDRLGFLGAPDFAPWVVAWLTGLSIMDAEDTVEMLVDAQLVEFVGVDRLGSLRYRLHDLVRLFARESAVARESEAELRQAVARVLGGWLAVVHRQSAESPPDDIRWPHPVDEIPDVPPVVVGDPRAWFEAEQECLVAGVERAATIGLHRLASGFAPEQYSTVVAGASRFELRERLITAVLNASRQAGDRYVEAIILADLGQLRYLQDDFAAARLQFQASLGLFRELGELRGQAATLAGLGVACREPGHLVEALHFLDEAAGMLTSLGDDTGIGYTRRIAGSVRLELGAYPAALSDLEVALSAYRRMGSQRGEALTLRTLSMHYRALGSFDQAAELATQSRDLFRGLGDEFLEGYAVRALAKANFRAGRFEGAAAQLESTLAVCRRLRDRWGEAATLRVIGELHLAQGELDLAEQQLIAALSVWDSMEAPLWRARTERDLSYVYEARGETELAAELLAAAVRTFHERGSREYAELTKVL